MSDQIPLDNVTENDVETTTDDFDQCYVCTEMAVPPIALVPCGHALCGQCLDGALTARASTTRTFSCGMCRAVVDAWTVPVGALRRVREHLTKHDKDRLGELDVPPPSCRDYVDATRRHQTVFSEELLTLETRMMNLTNSMISLHGSLASVRHRAETLERRTDTTTTGVSASLNDVLREYEGATTHTRWHFPGFTTNNGDGFRRAIDGIIRDHFENNDNDDAQPLVGPTTTFATANERAHRDTQSSSPANASVGDVAADRLRPVSFFGRFHRRMVQAMIRTETSEPAHIIIPEGPRAFPFNQDDDDDDNDDDDDDDDDDEMPPLLPI